ncbi:MAG: hypothetical protein ACPG32_14940, partial [Akkermansiaceae bacterium]
MSTWETKKESPLPPWLLVGGDFRYLRLLDDNRDYQFLMQADLSFGVDFKKFGANFTLGSYGGDRVKKLRSAYIQYKPDETVSIRAGKYIPHYGILYADHTVYTRKWLGFGQGEEAYGLELDVAGRIGEVTATVFRKQSRDEFSFTDPNYKVVDNGTALRASLFF